MDSETRMQRTPKKPIRSKRNTRARSVGQICPPGSRSSSLYSGSSSGSSSRSTPNGRNSRAERTRHRSICSPNGLTKTSIKRIQSIRDSRTEIGSILEHSTLQISRLDSDFEQSIFKVDEDESHHHGMASFMDQSMATIPDYDPAVKTYDCAICRRKFYHENSLDAHMVLHSTRDTLSRYGREPPNDRIPHSKNDKNCKFCRKSFTSKWKLRFHIAKNHFKSVQSHLLLVL